MEEQKIAIFLPDPKGRPSRNPRIIAYLGDVIHDDIGDMGNDIDDLCIPYPGVGQDRITDNDVPQEGGLWIFEGKHDEEDDEEDYDYYGTYRRPDREELAAITTLADGWRFAG